MRMSDQCGADRHASVGWIGVSLLMVFALGACGHLGHRHRPAWEQPPPAIDPAPVVAPGALHRARLENGLTVLVLEDHRLPRVSLNLTVRRGAGAVPPAQAGLAAFMAELMNRGAGERDALELARSVDDLGAGLAVVAGWDATDVAVGGLSSDLEALFGILRDVVRSPRFDPSEAKKTRDEQLAGLAATRDDPSSLARQTTMKVLYPKHRYGRPLSGTPDAVAAFEAKDARALHARYFVPGNAILSVVGDVRTKEVVRQARAAFGEWPEGEIPAETPKPPVVTPVKRRVVIADSPDLVQSRILIGQEGISRTSPLRLPANLLNSTLGGSGFSSRMMKNLRSDAGLTYGVRSGFSLRRRAGPFLVSTFTRVPETRRAVNLLLADLEAIRGPQPQTAEELAKAKSYTVGQFGLGLETSEAVMSALVDLSVFGLPDDSLDTFRARVEAVDLEQTAQAARELLHPGRAAIVILGPADTLRSQLNGLGDVEVVDP